MANSFFDLHFHPLFKTFVSQYELNLPTKRKADTLTKPFKLNSRLANTIDDVVLRILKSQCSFEQCFEGKLRIGVASIANIEFGFADSRRFLSEILKSSFTAPMDKKYFTLVREGQVSYYRLLLKELDLYLKLARENPTIHFLTRKNKSHNLANSKGVWLLMSLEGGHNLYRMKIGQTLRADNDFNDFDDKDPFVIDLKKGVDMGINPVESLRSLHATLWAAGMDLFYLTLTHLSHIAEQFLGTHAYGMKMLKHSSFYPSGNGLSALGKDLIRSCYSSTQDGMSTPILIDIKHMGLKTRADLYKLRKDEGFEQPLIASHMGVTGYSIKEWKDALQKEKCKVYNFEGVKAVEIQMERKRCGEWGSAINNEFTFNPWSINLMDEDIIAVLESGGLIGVCLDVRILGFQAKIGLNTGEQSEYVSTSDFQTHFPDVGLLNLPVDKLESMALTAESWLVPTKEDRHPLSLCFNIIHIVAVGKLRTDVEPWEHICIGSDFDGLIEPLKISPDISSTDDLEYNLMKWLPVAAKSYEKENGGVEIFSADFLADTKKLKAIVQGVMYENGRRFVEKWLGVESSETGASGGPRLATALS